MVNASVPSPRRSMALKQAAPRIPATGTTIQCVDAAWQALLQHWSATIRTTAVDAKHDAAFGFALYAMELLREVLRPGAASTIGARSTLRTLAEIHITFRYLATKNDDRLWRAFRAHGAGQAKLAFLKLDKLDAEVSHVSDETLSALANEDVWQELQTINVGHWEAKDLRKMAEEASLKNDYDRFYGWPSVFVHGHWSAQRDSVFMTCRNPLHRLHRIPRREVRQLEDVVADAAELVDGVLRTLDMVFPSFPHRTAGSPR
jgi:hypothetical protein